MSNTTKKNFITYDRPLNPKYENAGRNIKYLYDKPIPFDPKTASKD